MYWVPGSWEEWPGAWTPGPGGGGAGAWTPGAGGGGAAVGPPHPKEGGLGSHPGLEQPLPLCYRLLQKPLHAGDVWVEGPTARRREQRSGHGTVGRPLSCISPPSPCVSRILRATVQQLIEGVSPSVSCCWWERGGLQGSWEEGLG